MPFAAGGNMFNDILKDLVEGVGGGTGAVLMGYDGIAIDQYFRPNEELDLQLVAVEYANILKDIRRTAEILDSGTLEEVSIRTEMFLVIVRIINEDFFVALTLRRDGNFGKARYLLQREAPRLREALA
jgi:predicted regulator of Ras-like GTPase activity (Roadblock/LC7/MglB family)